MSAAAAAAATPCSSFLLCELRLLVRLLYKHKSAHRRGPYFRKLVEARRAVQTVHAALGGTDDDAEDAIATSAPVAASPALCAILTRSQHVLLRSSGPLYGLLGQTYFMSFALAAVAILARLYAAQRSILLAQLEAIARDSQGGATAAEYPHSLAERLRRALRSGVDERAWIERCDGRDLLARADDADDEIAGTHKAGDENDLPRTLLAVASTAAMVCSDGDSDEDDEPMPNATASSVKAAAAAAAAAMPAHLSFFAASAKATPSKVGAKVLAASSATPTTTKNKNNSTASPTAAAFRTPLKTAGNVKSLVSPSPSLAPSPSFSPPPPSPAKHTRPGQSLSTHAAPNVTLAAPATKGGLKRKQPSTLTPSTLPAVTLPAPKTDPSPSPPPPTLASNSTLATSPPPPPPAKKRQRLAGGPFAPTTPPLARKSTTTPCVDFISLGLRAHPLPPPSTTATNPAPLPASAAVMLKKKLVKKEKVQRAAPKDDEMDDIFG